MTSDNANVPPAPRAQGGDRRAQQIQAACDVLVSAGIRDAPITTLPAELVDAVNGVPEQPRTHRRCTCGTRYPASQCGARGMACMGDYEGIPHSPGCTFPAGHDGDHSWQRRARETS